MLTPSDLKAAFEDNEKEDDTLPDMEADESNDAIDEAAPKEKDESDPDKKDTTDQSTEKKESTPDDAKKSDIPDGLFDDKEDDHEDNHEDNDSADKGTAGDTGTDSGDNADSADDTGKAAGDNATDTPAASDTDTSHVDDAASQPADATPAADDAKKELMQETPTPETTPVEQSVTLNDTSVDIAPKDDTGTALSQDEVGSLEKMIETLDAPSLPMSAKIRISALYANMLKYPKGLKTFGLESHFNPSSQSDVSILVTALKKRIGKMA